MITLIGRLLGGAITLVFIALSATLALNNPDVVTLSLWPWSTSIAVPIWLVVVCAFGVGLVLGGLAMLPSLMRQRLAMRKLTKALAKKEKATLTQANVTKANNEPALPAK